MIEHVSLRVSDPRKSRAFYERALGPLGYKLSKKYGDAFGFKQGGRHDFWVTRGSVGTPTHIAFHAADRDEVGSFYQAALKAGGRDNGAPGVRGGYGFAAFVLDPDGHNVEAVVWKEDERRAPARSRAQKAHATARARSRASRAT